MTRKDHRREFIAALAATVATVTVLVGCTKITDPGHTDIYLAPTSEANLINNLAESYRRKEILHYVDILADDFRFYFDEDTRTREGLSEFLNRFEDSTATDRLFTSQEISDIRITLTRDKEPQRVNEIGKERWTEVDIGQVLLEVDRLPRAGENEVTTFRVQNQLQKYYFRKGRTEDDTDTTTSETAKRYYLVEWRDQGLTNAKASEHLP